MENYLDVPKILGRELEEPGRPGVKIIEVHRPVEAVVPVRRPWSG